jgi:hypothetical protein
MLALLPKQIQESALAAYDSFVENPDHPSLGHHELKKTKKGQHKTSSWAVSVTRRYRAIYLRDGNDNVWYWIGSHEDYNNFTGK